METLTGEIRKGDLIAIAYNNMFWLGVYLGRGQGFSLQYYSIEQADWFLERYKQGKKLYKNYINSVGYRRVMRIDYDSVTDSSVREKYEKIYKIINKEKV